VECQTLILDQGEKFDLVCLVEPVHQVGRCAPVGLAGGWAGSFPVVVFTTSKQRRNTVIVQESVGKHPSIRLCQSSPD
jgi:hypothetical protein